MEPSRKPEEMHLEKSLFSPFHAKTLKVQADKGFLYESACYNPKYNMIIACPDNNSIQFYDGTTFKPYEKRSFLMINSVSQMSFHPESDTCLLGGMSGFIYKYDVSKSELETVTQSDGTMLGITFLNSTLYAFSLLESAKLYVRDLNNNRIALTFDLNCTPSFGLYHLDKRNLLFSGLSNGSVKAFRTNKLPDLKAICSAKTEGWTLAIQSFNINGKEYVVAANENNKIKIWHLLKGKMKLLNPL